MSEKYYINQSRKANVDVDLNTVNFYRYISLTLYTLVYSIVAIIVGIILFETTPFVIITALALIPIWVILLCIPKIGWLFLIKKKKLKQYLYDNTSLSEEAFNDTTELAKAFHYANRKLKSTWFIEQYYNTSSRKVKKSHNRYQRGYMVITFQSHITQDGKRTYTRVLSLDSPFYGTYKSKELHDSYKNMLTILDAASFDGSIPQKELEKAFADTNKIYKETLKLSSPSLKELEYAATAVNQITKRVELFRGEDNKGTENRLSGKFDKIAKAKIEEETEEKVEVKREPEPIVIPDII